MVEEKCYNWCIIKAMFHVSDVTHAPITTCHINKLQKLFIYFFSETENTFQTKIAYYPFF